MHSSEARLSGFRLSACVYGVPVDEPIQEWQTGTQGGMFNVEGSTSNADRCRERYTHI